ncbi:TPA: hypothetical protein ENS27_13785 [bacterium]|nr:hypothetical protein [bacterium]
MTEAIDLWPDKIAIDEKIITPVTILRQQASLLSDKTQNVLEGEVEDVKNTSEPYDFHYAFYIIAPNLNNYRYRLLDIFYNISPLYPLRVELETDIYKEISPKFKSQKRTIGATSEKDFLDLLKEIFNSKKVLRVISVLLSQSDPSYDPSLKEETQQ